MSIETILVVEDDVALLEGLRDILELSGYRVLTAANGVEALQRLKEQTPHLIVSDIMMPLMDGYQLHEAVRVQVALLEVPFIFLTARAEPQDVRRGRRLGADDYLVKPFDEEDLLIVIRNRLNRRRQAETARRAQMAELKRTILTTLNHEFRTPLAHITTFTEMLSSTPDLNSDDVRGYLKGIEQGSARLSRLVGDFILLVEFQTGEAQATFLQRREVLTDLASILETVARQNEPAARTRGVALELDFEPGLPPVLGDRELLSNAVHRLVENAIKFSKRAGGPVIVRACLADGGLVIDVVDHGIGLTPEALERAFEAFQQIGRDKLEQQGIGSGLTIAREIVHLHDGSLTATSQPDVGSTFTIRLPVWEPRPAPPP